MFIYNDFTFAHKEKKCISWTTLRINCEFCYNLFNKFYYSLFHIGYMNFQERNPGDAKRYNDIILHETLRVAVCDMLEQRCPCPDALR